MKAFFALTLKMEGMEQPPGQVDQSRAKTTVGKAFHIRGLCKSPSTGENPGLLSEQEKVLLEEEMWKEMWVNGNHGMQKMAAAGMCTRGISEGELKRVTVAFAVDKLSRSCAKLTQCRDLRICLFAGWMRLLASSNSRNNTSEAIRWSLTQDHWNYSIWIQKANHNVCSIIKPSDSSWHGLCSGCYQTQRWTFLPCYVAQFSYRVTICFSREGNWDLTFAGISLGHGV